MMPSDERRDQGGDTNWWVERLKTKERAKPAEQQAFAGASFFRTVEGYDQEQATKNLTDLNLNLLIEARATPGAWAYLPLIEDRCSHEQMERVKRALPLPRDAYGVLVDSGHALRAIISGTPMGERLLEFNFIDEASFDCWIKGEWVCERVYRGRRELLRRAADLLRRYMAKDLMKEDGFFSAPHAQGALPPARTEW